VETFAAWWQRVSETLPEGVKGLWFGMAEFDPGGWCLYVAGTDRFDALDPSAEWAVGPYVWWPQDRFPVPRLGGLPVGEAVQYAAALVREVAPWEALAVQGAAVGFDEGDFELVYPRS
jgi:hypothetical protein